MMELVGVEFFLDPDKQNRIPKDQFLDRGVDGLLDL